MIETRNMDSSRKRCKRVSVKSGCRTCKIRKLKCDETHPSCNRCTSTGRKCDGYGIWSTAISTPTSIPASTSIPTSTSISNSTTSNSPFLSRQPVSALTSSPEETRSFSWFKCRSSIKLPGSYSSTFWSKLLLQASIAEPSILHAVLALSSVHKRGIAHIDNGQDDPNTPEDQEQFTLSHYLKAIRHLQPHLQPQLAKDKSSIRITLIACIVFVSLELLRGHFATAQSHLHNGLKILEELEMLRQDEGVLCVKPCRDATDEWILQGLCRLQLQVQLFRYGSRHGSLLLQMGPDIPALEFKATNEAWHELERLMNKVFHLTRLSHEQTLFTLKPHHHPKLLEKQQQLRHDLAQWSILYQALQKTTQDTCSASEAKRQTVLRPYHAMATIMAETCLRSDEAIFDSYTSHFILLTKQLADMSVSTPGPTLPDHPMDMSRSIVDVGWIAPLHYVATKCRVHRIRLHAVRLLETRSHREGIWDGKTAACVARKVMEMEEGNFYNDVVTDDTFSLASHPRAEDPALSALPVSHRMREVEVVLSGAPMDKVQLYCRREQQGVDRRTLVSEYDVRSQRWIDGE